METDKLMEQLRGEVDGLKENVGEIGENVRDIKLALLGSDYSGGKGIINEVRKLEERFNAFEKMIDRYKNILVGLSIGAGVGVAKILQMIVDAFTKH